MPSEGTFCMSLSTLGLQNPCFSGWGSGGGRGDGGGGRRMIVSSNQGKRVVLAFQQSWGGYCCLFLDSKAVLPAGVGGISHFGFL